MATEARTPETDRPALTGDGGPVTAPTDAQQANPSAQIPDKAIIAVALTMALSLPGAVGLA